MKVFSERLLILREEKGLTREELAKQTGFTTASIWRWETHVQIPNIETLAVFAKFFGCSSDYLIGIED